MNAHHLAMQSETPVRLQLKAMRKEARLTVREMAEAAGFDAHSTYSSYEDKFKKKFLPIELVKLIEPVFVERGIPVNRIRALAGFVSERTTAVNDSDSNITETDDGTAAFAELDVRGSMGGGANMDGDGNETVHVWRMPREMVRAASYAPPDKIKIITVVGDGMGETFRPFERVMVDIADTSPTPPGIFVVFDGLGLVVKRVEYVPHSDPATVRITSDNPRYPPYERSVDEAYIQGRVLGRWQWV